MSTQISTVTPAADITESVYVAKLIELFEQFPLVVTAVITRECGERIDFTREGIAHVARLDLMNPAGPVLLGQILTDEAGRDRDLALDETIAQENWETR